MKLDKKTWWWCAGLLTFGILMTWAVFHFATVSKGIVYVWKLLVPFLVGIILAYILNIPMQFFKKKVFYKCKPKTAKSLSFLCLTLCVLLVVGFFLLVLIPQFTKSIISLAQSIPGKLKILQAKIEANPDIVPAIKQQLSSVTIDWEKISKTAVPVIQKNSGTFLTTAFNSVGAAVQSLVTFFIGLSLAIYLLMNSESVKAAMHNVLHATLPAKVKAPLGKVVGISDEIFRHFVIVQCLQCVIIAVLMALGLVIVGVKYWLIFSVLIGILSIIPKLGSFIGVIISIIIVFIEQGGTKVLLFLAVFVVVSLINENVIYAKLITSTLKIPEIGIMISSIIGGTLFGASGAILFIPIFGITYTLFKGWVYARLNKKQLAVETPTIKGEDEMI